MPREIIGPGGGVFDVFDPDKPASITLAPVNGHAKLPATVKLLSAASVRAVRVGWLWEGWLARGKVHLLAGSPGTGKTTIAVSFCAAITAGGRWPDGTDVEIGRLPDLVWGGWPWRYAGAAVSRDRGRSQAPPIREQCNRAWPAEAVRSRT